MDISIEDDEKTLTMVGPDFDGTKETAGTCTSSTRAEDNKEEILELFQRAFADLTSVADLQSFLFLYSRVRVMVSVEKLLELNGDECVASTSTELDVNHICGEKLSYSVFTCGSRVEIVWKCKRGH